MKKFVTLFITLIVLASALVVPVQASTDAIEDDDTGVCQPMSWSELSNILSMQIGPAHILGMPEPFLMAEVGGGTVSDLAYHGGDDSDHSCTPGASCEHGQPGCACHMHCTGCREAYTDNACVAIIMLNVCTKISDPIWRGVCAAGARASCYYPRSCDHCGRRCTQNC